MQTRTRIIGSYKQKVSSPLSAEQIAKRIVFEQMVSFWSNKLIDESMFIDSIQSLLPSLKSKQYLIKDFLHKIQSEIQNHGEDANLDELWEKIEYKSRM